MIHTPQTPTAFAACIRMLSERSGSVPPGWRPAYYDTLHGLRAVDCGARGSMKLSGPFVSDDAVLIIASGNDYKVDSILHRLERKSACICQTCGRLGKPRDLGHKVAVLCPSCAAPRLLQGALKKLIAELAASANFDRPVILPFDQFPVPLRSVVPASVWWPVQTVSGADESNCTTHDALRRHLRRFEQVLAALDCQHDDKDYD